jgi:hypothetical protein
MIVPISNIFRAALALARLMPVLAVFLLALFLCGCESMWKDLSKKSVNSGSSGMVFLLTTSVDPQTGAICPEVKFGDCTLDVTTHLPGDGTNVSINSQKATWTSAVGSDIIKITGKGGLKNFYYSYNAQTGVILRFDDIESMSTAAKMLQAEVLAAVKGKTRAELQSMLDSLNIARAANKDLAAYAQLEKMPDSTLYSLTATEDTAGNRLIGDEIMSRVLMASINSAQK